MSTDSTFIPVSGATGPATAGTPPTSTPPGGGSAPARNGDAARPAELVTDPLAEKVLAPFNRFFHAEASGGLVLLFNTLLALVWANSPWSESYHHLWETTLTVGVPGFALEKTIHHWINDGLMAVFFFVVGLEIKREVLVGELTSIRQAALPLVAAIGGMIVPAALYALATMGTGASVGWGVPMATDIAFALGIAAMMGPRVPTSLKVFLAALAIVDDIGAVLVIALFYSGAIAWQAIGLAAVVFALLFAINRAGVRAVTPYVILGVILWIAVLKSGIHATIAGVLLAFTIPATVRIDGNQFIREAREQLDDFKRACGDDDIEFLTTQQHQEPVFHLEDSIRRIQPPLLRLEHRLHGWVAFFIMPLFALANAGVALRGDLGALVTEVSVVGVVLGLAIGKPLGIVGFSWAAVKLRLAELPSGTGWRHLVGVGALGGIGFTMALFIAGLAFGAGEQLEAAKFGILAASLIAGLTGWQVLRRCSVQTS